MPADRPRPKRRLPSSSVANTRLKRVLLQCSAPNAERPSGVYVRPHARYGTLTFPGFDSKPAAG